MKWNFVWILMMSFLFLQGQNVFVKGRTLDTFSRPMEQVNISALNTIDSSILQTQFSDVDGRFKFNFNKPQSILLKCSKLNYTDQFIFLKIEPPGVDVGLIVLTTQSFQLPEVDIVSVGSKTNLKGDTLVYNASVYKTNVDASAEELITKMPGMVVQNGKVQVQGEELKQVFLDGKPFFGDDQSAALRQIPADIIDKIEVFDRRSDQSIFTGFDDGNTSKTINITTRPEFRNGQFGKAYFGSNLNDKWRSGISLNHFDGKKRFTLLGISNNVNEQNFSQEDLTNIAPGQNGPNRPQNPSSNRSNRVGGGGREGNAIENFLIDPKLGISRTNSIGVNYSNQWKRIEYTGSYFINELDNVNQSTWERNYIVKLNKPPKEVERNLSTSKSLAHKANLKVEWKIDSAHSLLFQPKFSMQRISTSSSSSSERKNELFTLTSGSIESTAHPINYSFSFPLLYKYNFKKNQRTFSLNLQPAFLRFRSTDEYQSITINRMDTSHAEKIDQHSDGQRWSNNYSTNINYTEPLNKRSLIQLSLLVSHSINYNETALSDFDTLSQSYSLINSILSNQLESYYTVEKPGVTYKWNHLKWNVTAGLSYQWGHFRILQELPSMYNKSRLFGNILPEFSIQGKLNRTDNIRINYRTNTVIPTIEQLQETPNLINPFYIKSGSLSLGQEYRRNISVRYNKVMTGTSQNIFLYLGGTRVTNYIANSVFVAVKDTFIFPDVLLRPGAQWSRPLNLNAYLNLRTFISYGLPLKKLGSTLNMNIGLVYSKQPSLINGNLNISRISNYNSSFTLASTSSKKWDVNLTFAPSYNINTNTIRQGTGNEYYGQNIKVKFQIELYKGLFIFSDYAYQLYSGNSDFANLNFSLWNAGIGYKFLKQKQADIRFSVFDLLNQNISFNRINYDAYYEDQQTNVLQQYFLIQASYNLKKFKSNSKSGHK